MAEFVLKVLDIDEAGKDHEFPVRQAWLAEALTGTGVRTAGVADGRFEVHAHAQGSDVVISGRISTSIVTACARCLEDAPIAVDTRVASLLSARGDSYRTVPDEQELTPQDLERDFFTGDRIVLDDMVREQILLEIPIKPLCAEGCDGIAVPSAVAGPRDLDDAAEGGVDPRLAPLLKLVGTFEPTEE